MSKPLWDGHDKTILRPHWASKCTTCGQSPIVPLSWLCGPCHFGTAAAAMGGWWDDEKDNMSEDIQF